MVPYQFQYDKVYIHIKLNKRFMMILISLLGLNDSKTYEIIKIVMKRKLNNWSDQYEAEVCCPF